MTIEKTAKPKTHYLSDYKPSDFAIRKVVLDFALFDNHTLVTAKLDFVKTNKRVKNLQLVGEGLELLALSLDGQAYDNYELSAEGLIVKKVPSNFTLSTQVKIHPEKNTLLEGLYRSNQIFCTQCEAEGFRRITYFLDRPDVMSEYYVRLEADKSKYPTLLSNGNLLEEGDCSNGRHYARWHDPFAKPCYLFAVVAGDLAVTAKTIQTASGREVLLQVFTEKDFIHQADYALGALERSMRWDEQTFALEYDLDRYMVVAIGDFNMGAMENKGLNIFNTKYVLATPETSTDKDFTNIENIIGHEYFHNWTGNRVTCRDWFQLSLKEGLTVFRDALFSADMTTKGIKRLEEVRTVREHQFIEDQGPMSHPVRPDNYIEINNFYTLTVYEKGAEVIRMMYNLIGEANFKKGMQLYFARHDGQAVTVEDFAQAMSDASGTDLTGQFFRWYTQSGTPTLKVKSEYDTGARTFKVHFSQHHSSTPGQTEKDNLIIPIAYRLYNESGEAMSSENVVVLDTADKTLEFGSVNTPPVLSLLRNFSAPVIVEYQQSDAELHVLVRHDDDLFVRYDALLTLLKRAVKQLISNPVAVEEIATPIAQTLTQVLHGDSPKAEIAELLHLPNLAVFFDVLSPIDVQVLAAAVEQLKSALAAQLDGVLQAAFATPAAYVADDLRFEAMGERALRNACLALLAIQPQERVQVLAKKYYDGATVMSNRLAALSALNQHPGELRDTALQDFYQRFKDDPLVVDKWLAMHAAFDDEQAFADVTQLSEHEAFSLTNPNKVRALYGTFCMHNSKQFHHPSGRGYKLLAELVGRLDGINPGIAARMITPLTQWQRFDSKAGQLMREQLQHLLANKELSKDLYEVVSKSLADD